MTEYQDVCYDCGSQMYPKRRDERIDGITVHSGICPVCHDEKTIIPADDWARRAGEAVLWD